MSKSKITKKTRRSRKPGPQSPISTRIPTVLERLETVQRAMTFGAIGLTLMKADEDALESLGVDHTDAMIHALTKALEDLHWVLHVDEIHKHPAPALQNWDGGQ